MKIVKVEWLDAWSESAEMTKEALEELSAVPRANIGYLIKEDENVLTLSSGPIWWGRIVGREDTFTDNVIIPRGSIQKIVVLEEGD